jgi:hypothetical protein
MAGVADIAMADGVDQVDAALAPGAIWAQMSTIGVAGSTASRHG